MHWLVEIIIFLIIIIVLIYINESKIKKQNRKMLDFTKLLEKEYQSYAQFNGINCTTDESYQTKMNLIYDLIVNNKEKNIKNISKKSKCSIEECILKIKYLKTKDIIDNYIIDTNNYKLIETTLEEKALILKYSDLLNNKKLQINQIAEVIPRTQGESIQQLQQRIYKDLINLYNKSLLDNLIINQETGYINYYIIEKKVE